MGYALILCGAVFVKSGMGMEFISPCLIMMTVPSFYYYFAYQQKKFHWAANFITASIAGLVGFSLSVFYLTLKLNPFGGFDKIMANFARRTGIGSEALGLVDPIYQASFNASYWEVLGKYLFQPHGFNLPGIIFMIPIVVWLYKNRKMKMTPQKKGLLAAFAVSILAPVSWFILAKSYCYIHSFSYLMWNFMNIFAFILISQFKAVPQKRGA
jgi:hypothetical protein